MPMLDDLPPVEGPKGLIPRETWDAAYTTALDPIRLKHLQKAILMRSMANEVIPPEWEEELKDIENRLANPVYE